MTNRNPLNGGVPRKIARLLPVIVISIIAVGSLVILAPFANDIVEAAVGIAAISCLGIVLGLYVPALYLTLMWQNRAVDAGTQARVAGLFVLFGALVYFPFISRQFQAELLQTQFDGVVVRKFNSANHQYMSIEVKSNDGASDILEGIDHAAWDAVKTGDNVVKESWSPYIYVNQQSVRIVPQGVLDSLRGLE